MFLHASTLEFMLTGGAPGAKRPYLLNAPLSSELIDVLDRLG
jgi:23S rRNA pseudouridine955/2504/2580 synthase